MDYEVFDAAMSDNKSFVVTKDAYTGIGSVPRCRLDVRGDIQVSGASIDGSGQL